jgi:hypothetical protein
VDVLPAIIAPSRHFFHLNISVQSDKQKPLGVVNRLQPIAALSALQALTAERVLMLPTRRSAMLQTTHARLEASEQLVLPERLQRLVRQQQVVLLAQLALLAATALVQVLRRNANPDTFRLLEIRALAH